MTAKSDTMEQPKAATTTYVRLMLACNDHRGNLEGLSAVELVRRDGDSAMEFDGDIEAGENLQFQQLMNGTRLHLVASGKLHNGKDGAKEFNAHLHGLKFYVGNLCWNHVTMELIDAVKMLNVLLSFKHWAVTSAPRGMFEAINESRWVTPEQVLAALA